MLVKYAFTAEYQEASASKSPVQASSPNKEGDEMTNVRKPFEFVAPLQLSVRTDKTTYVPGDIVHVEIQSPIVPCDGIPCSCLRVFNLLISTRSSFRHYQGGADFQEVRLPCNIMYVIIPFLIFMVVFNFL